jgi:hypothetical protein
MADAKGKTQVDNFVLPPAFIWVLWACFVPGFFLQPIFLFHIVWLEPPPSNPANFSPVVQAQFIRSAPERFFK